ncbi:hypothetical protein Bbelb_074350 [Branchiostoma belcheri]|nr:hypothetical protein Bbelb_074350 [Branchiostoma belcheri]
MSILRTFRIGAQLWDMYKNYKRRSTKPTIEEESSPPATHMDKAEHRNVGSTTYWGCVNKTIYITGDKESMTTGGHDNQAGTNDTGSKIYVACRIENYHVTVTDRTT